MSISPSELCGRFFDGRSTRPIEVTIHCGADTLRLSGGVEREWPLAMVEIGERVGGAQRRIHLPQDAFVEVADGPQWDALPQRGGRHLSWLVKLETHWRAVAVAALATVLLTWAAYVWMLPAGVQWICERIPASWVARLSTESMDLLDKVYTDDSKLPRARREQLARAFAAWRAPDGDKPAYRLHFRDGTRLGPNALALPSGDIVITDQLIAKAEDDTEILGVLAHELGHVRERHGLRQTVQAALLVLTANLMLGDTADMTGSVAALLSLRYSRDFEREADAYAARMMRANGADPAHLGRLLKRLDGGDASFAYLGTHPLSEERAESLGMK